MNSGKIYSIKNPGNMAHNIVNLLLGASMAMRATSTYRLQSLTCTDKEVTFWTDCVNFVTAYDVELSNYGLRIEGDGFFNWKRYSIEIETQAQIEDARRDEEDSFFRGGPIPNENGTNLI